MRILGLGMDATRPQSKWRPLYDALAMRFDVVELLEPRVSRTSKGIILARHAHRDPRTWLARAGYSPAMFRARARALENTLSDRDGDYDLIVQSQTVFAPGTSFAKRNYVIYTDATRALNEAHPYLGAPSTERAKRERKLLEAEVGQHATRVFTMSEWARR